MSTEFRIVRGAIITLILATLTGCVTTADATCHWSKETGWHCTAGASGLPAPGLPE